MKQLLFITLLLAFLLSACNQGSKSTVDNKIDFDTIEVVKVYHINNDSTQPSFNLTLDYLYPVSLQDTAVLKKLQDNFIEIYLEDEAYLNPSADSAINMYVSNSIRRFDEEIKAYYETPIFHDEADVYLSYYDKIKGETLFNKNNILSFQTARFINKGKATSTKFSNYVFDLNTGEIVTEDDIFNLNFETEMTQLIIRKIFEANNVKSISELTDIGYLQDIEEIIPNRNFSIDEKGITYIYNRGEYAALPIEEIRVSFTYDELTPYLKENTIISSLSGK